MQTKAKANKLEDILKHIELLEKAYGERFAVMNMRSHLAFYLKKCAVPALERVEIMQIESLGELKEKLRAVVK